MSITPGMRNRWFSTCADVSFSFWCTFFRVNVFSSVWIGWLRMAFLTFGKVQNSEYSLFSPGDGRWMSAGWLLFRYFLKQMINIYFCWLDALGWISGSFENELDIIGKPFLSLLQIGPGSKEKLFWRLHDCLHCRLHLFLWDFQGKSKRLVETYVFFLRSKGWLLFFFSVFHSCCFPFYTIFRLLPPFSYACACLSDFTLPPRPFFFSSLLFLLFSPRTVNFSISFTVLHRIATKPFIMFKNVLKGCQGSGFLTLNESRFLPDVWLLFLLYVWMVPLSVLISF